MSDEFQNNIQSWVSLDNRIKNLSQEVKIYVLNVTH